MPIGYDNEVGHCIRSLDIEEGHWFLSAEGELFIVPRDGEIEGPDGEAFDKLETAYRRMGFDAVDEETLAQELGMTLAYGWQQRFSPEEGYFVA